jgi:hypothetical protein
MRRVFSFASNHSFHRGGRATFIVNQAVNAVALSKPPK